MSLSELWNESVTFSLIQKICIGLFLLVIAVLIYVINWYLALSSIKEYGYPKVSDKRITKRWKSYSTIDKIWLISLKREAKRNGFGLYLYWWMNIFNLFCAMVSLIGFVCFAIFPTKGWQIILMLFIPFASFVLSMAIRFIPDLILLPSERYRYFGGKRK